MFPEMINILLMIDNLDGRSDEDDGILYNLDTLITTYMIYGAVIGTIAG
jgi:hypothetical protein